MSAFAYKVLEDGITIEELLKDDWKVGKKTVHLMRMAKSITTADGNPIDWKAPLSKETLIHLSIPEASSIYEIEKKPVKIAYEDEHILAVYKPAGLSVHPDGKSGIGTLMNRVMNYIVGQGGEYAEHIHRLDKGTAGILLVAKHPIAKAIFDRMIENQQIERIYTAETEGILKADEGTIKEPIGKDRHNASKRRVSPSGQYAVTHYKVIQRKANSSIVEASLETGRTHQIRVHFSHIGHPIVGDTLYGGAPTRDGLYRLEATKLSFIHPFTLEKITITR